MKISKLKKSYKILFWKNKIRKKISIICKKIKIRINKYYKNKTQKKFKILKNNYRKKIKKFQK